MRTFDVDQVIKTNFAYLDKNAAGTGRNDPGLGDDIACAKCGQITLDTGLECTNCGYDNYKAVYGITFESAQNL